MTVEALIAFLQTKPPHLICAYRRYSEQSILNVEDIKIDEACVARPDGWIENKRPDKTTQKYLLFPGN